MHSDRYTIIFALVVCVSCSIVLALAAGALKPTIQKNEILDVQKNILMATGIVDDPKSVSPDEMTELYASSIKELVIDKTGSLVADITPKDLEDSRDDTKFALYIREENSEILSYCFPVSGKGLWSTIYGYVALENDGKTVKGVTFYKHGETPGLGGEVDKKWFADNFKGKTVFNARGELTPLIVCKGKIPAGLSAEKLAYTVDGISGSTLTGNGVNVFLEQDLKKYEPYLKMIMAGSVGS